MTPKFGEYQNTPPSEDIFHYLELFGRSTLHQLCLTDSKAVADEQLVFARKGYPMRGRQRMHGRLVLTFCWTWLCWEVNNIGYFSIREFFGDSTNRSEILATNSKFDFYLVKIAPLRKQIGFFSQS